MPTRPPTRCGKCKRLHTDTGWCSDCRLKAAAARRRSADRDRPSASERGYGAEHRTRFRADVLDRDQVCVVCRQAPSTVADHWPLSRRELVARGLDPNDGRHGRGVCKPCHDRHTAATTDGGFRRGRKPRG